MYEEIYETYKKVSKDNIDRDLFTKEKESNDELIEDIKNNKLVIYTAFTGDYDTLKIPDVVDENTDYICFSDNPDLKSDFWEIRLMDDSTLDNNRKAKQYKVLPHVYLPEYKYSFWLDGTFKIKGSIREYIYKFLKKDSNMINVVHTERDCVYKEYKASKIIPRYPRAVMEEQVESYKSEGFPEHFGLAVMGAIFRQHNDPKIIDLMEDWWDEIIKYTNQDQLSFAYVAWKNDFHPSVSLIYYWDNEFWAKEEIEGKQYHHKVVFPNPITSDNLREKITEKVWNMELGETLDLSREELYLLINDVKGMAGYRIDTAGRIGFLNNEKNELLNSNSFKVTKPLRSIKKLKPDRLMFDSKDEQKIYNKINALGLINVDIYHKYHSNVPYNLLILDYIRNGSKIDSDEVKSEYINPLFDLYYYKERNDINDETDPLIHYITKGFSNKCEINNDEENFVKSLDENLNEQYNKYVSSKIANELKNYYYSYDEDILTQYIESNQLYPTDTIKVGVFLEDSYNNMNACPFIRIHTPFKELSKTGDYHFFVYGKELLPKINMANIINDKIFDIIVIQRVNPYSTQILKRAKRLGIKIIYETDDNFIELNPNHPSYDYILGNKDNIQKVVVSADLITVSTPELANKFKQFGFNNIEIVKNYHTSNISSLKPFKQRENIKIGYFGTITHSDDLKIMHNVILNVKNYFKDIDVEFEVVGITFDKEDWYSYRQLPYYPMSAPTFTKWTQNELNWDIGVAPLSDSDFNKSKSELKYIEYTALGIPTVASDSPSYKEAITDGVDGFLASNEEEWINKIIKLVDNPGLRHDMVYNARKNILKNYNLSDRVKQWDKIFKSLK